MREENVRTAARCLKVLAHPQRLKVIGALRDRELSVQEVMSELKISQSSASQHLNLMKDRNVLDSRREGNQVFYWVRDKKVLKLIDLIQDLFCPPGK